MNSSVIRRTTRTAAAAAVLAGLVTAAGPAAASGSACVPEVLALPPLTADGGGEVSDFGPNGLAVGSSAGLPAYWTADRAVHAVPVPAGFQSGSVRAVNSWGLMVGTLVSGGPGSAQAAFTYRLGEASVQLITGAAVSNAAVDVNDAGHVVGVDGGIAKVWLNGAVLRELPLPQDAHPGTVISSVGAVNKRGDIVGTARTEYWDEPNDLMVAKTFPVVWPAGGYPTYSLPVWTGDDPTVGSHATDIDDKGRVVGYEKESYRDVQRRTPAAWKRPYDALPTAVAPVTGYGNATLDSVSPTTNVSVGTAVNFVEGYANHIRAAYWPGRGPMLALPLPDGGGPDWRSEATAVSDDDRVGGWYLNWQTGESKAVVWTCAGAQAYAPQG
ncbi:hypothetical protein ACFWUQ_24810 [Streptomyces sp. NPDC058662]|uniref:hypothetical protein n=1 Tax=Streptomyces sp. NPDC058662 TaxID=3346583 RepID=UPI003655B390